MHTVLLFMSHVHIEIVFVFFVYIYIYHILQQLHIHTYGGIFHTSSHFIYHHILLKSTFKHRAKIDHKLPPWDAASAPHDHLRGARGPPSSDSGLLPGLLVKLIIPIHMMMFIVYDLKEPLKFRHHIM